MLENENEAQVHLYREKSLDQRQPPLASGRPRSTSATSVRNTFTIYNPTIAEVIQVLFAFHFSIK